MLEFFIGSGPGLGLDMWLPFPQYRLVFDRNFKFWKLIFCPLPAPAYKPAHLHTHWRGYPPSPSLPSILVLSLRPSRDLDPSEFFVSRTQLNTLPHYLWMTPVAGNVHMLKLCHRLAPFLRPLELICCCRRRRCRRCRRCRRRHRRRRSRRHHSCRWKRDENERERRESFLLLWREHDNLSQ